MARGFIVLHLLIIFFARFAFAQTENVKLSWVHIPYASSYEIEVSRLGNQGRPLMVRTVDIPEIAVDLPPGSYNYRVRGQAASGKKGPWSDLQRFEVKLENIALITPDGKSDINTRVRLNWKGASGYRYRIQIIDLKNVVISDRETSDTFFIWNPPTTGQFRWRVAYANVTQSPWSEYRSLQISGRANPLAKIDKPKSKWNKTIWAGANVNSYDGEFADTANVVTASTVSGLYSFELERKHERFSPYSEPRPSAHFGIKQQSLIKKTAWMPDADLAYHHLWTWRYLKFGPTIDAGYGKSAFFTADAFGNYNFGSFWRSKYSAGIYGEYLFRKFLLSFFGKFGATSGGDSSLAEGGVKPSTFTEAGIGGRLVRAAKWTLQLRFFNEDVKWTSSRGNNILQSTNWSIDIGGQL